MIDRSTSAKAARRRHFAAVWFESDWRGVGSFLWICDQLQLDSGVQREQTHRFYFREGLTINCYHFRIDL